jgi:hypothetical protein
MKKKILSALLFMGIALFSFAQNLNSFTVTLPVKEDSNNYVSIAHKKAYSLAEARNNKTALDFALIVSAENGTQKTTWYNMSGKDNMTPKELNGTTSLINAISFDREQFDKCKTPADLKRITGYITHNSLSHFAVIRNSKDYYQRCFIFEKADGKRGLIFVTERGNNRMEVEVKTE